MTDLRSRSGLRRVSRRDKRRRASPPTPIRSPPVLSIPSALARRRRVHLIPRDASSPVAAFARTLSANRACAESAAATAVVVEARDPKRLRRRLEAADGSEEASEEAFEEAFDDAFVSFRVVCSFRSQMVVSAHLLGNSAPGPAGDGDRPVAATAAMAFAACAGVRASNATRRSIAAARASTTSCGTRSGAWTRARSCARRWRWCRVTSGRERAASAGARRLDRKEGWRAHAARCSCGAAARARARWRVAAA